MKSNRGAQKLLEKPHPEKLKETKHSDHIFNN